MKQFSPYDTILMATLKTLTLCQPQLTFPLFWPTLSISKRQNFND
jgi:hypothetical protein